MKKPKTVKSDHQEIKRLTKKSLDKLHKLFNEVLDYLSDKYYPRELIEEYKEGFNKSYIQKNVFENKKAIALGYFYSNKFVGFAWGRHMASGLFYLDWIGVKEEYMGQGIFKNLIKEVEKRVKKGRSHKIYLFTYIKNRPAIKGYLKLNYKIEGIHRNHFDGGDFIAIGKTFKKIVWKGKISKTLDFKLKEIKIME